MGNEDWVLKGTKLITNTKKPRLKIESTGWIFKNTILKKKIHNNDNICVCVYIYIYIYKYIYEVCFKK